MSWKMSWNYALKKCLEKCPEKGPQIMPWKRGQNFWPVFSGHYSRPLKCPGGKSFGQQMNRPRLFILATASQTRPFLAIWSSRKRLWLVCTDASWYLLVAILCRLLTLDRFLGRLDVVEHVFGRDLGAPVIHRKFAENLNTPRESKLCPMNPWLLGSTTTFGL